MITKKPIGHKPIRRRPEPPRIPYKANHSKVWYVWKFVKDLARNVSRLMRSSGKCRYCDHSIGCGCQIDPGDKQIGGYCIISLDSKTLSEILVLACQ
jgi:hypothetical protein